MSPRGWALSAGEGQLSGDLGRFEKEDGGLGVYIEILPSRVAKWSARVAAAPSSSSTNFPLI